MLYILRAPNLNAQSFAFRRVSTRRKKRGPAPSVYCQRENQYRLLIPAMVNGKTPSALIRASLFTSALHCFSVLDAQDGIISS